jgi:hypothetical protein
MTGRGEKKESKKKKENERKAGVFWLKCSSVFSQKVQLNNSKGFHTFVVLFHTGYTMKFRYLCIYENKTDYTQTTTANQL